MIPLGGYMLFAAGVIPGEEVEVEVVNAGARHGRARLLGVLKPSPDRVAPKCRHFGTCGGCSWQHLAYPAQLRAKEALVRSALSHALGRPAPVRPARGLSPPWGFRNKVHYTVGRNRRGETLVGHLAARSRDVVPISECPVHSERGNRVAFALRDALLRYRIPPAEGDPPRRGIARHLLVRTGESTEEALAVLVAAREEFPGRDEVAAAMGEPSSGASGFFVNVNDREGSQILGRVTVALGGRERLLETVGGASFFVSPVSFFQTSVRAAEALLAVVLEAVGEGAGSVLDLYAGVGLFAIPLGMRGAKVVAVEENPLAVRDGIRSVKKNALSRVRFFAGRAEEHARRLGGEREFDAVILDPPREGASERVLGAIASQIRAPRVVYVSCDLRALGRDLKFLAGAGYRLEAVTPVDMFPHTAHVETVAVLTR
jgi:23S rRNA (uracil1939-C5)-methyltransferase